MNSPTMAVQPPFQNHEERAMRSSRDAREAARAAKNANASHFRRAHSPPPNEYRYGENDEPRTPTSNTSVALQEAIPAQQHQQRLVQVGGHPNQNPAQRRPPPANNTSPDRGGQKLPPPSKSLPPSYPGPPLEDVPHEGRYRHSRNPSNSGPAVRRPSGTEMQPNRAGGSPPRQGGPIHNQRPQSMTAADAAIPRRPLSPGGLSISGQSISRLASPSIQKSVLQPLEQKIKEYDNLMEESSIQIEQLDEELRLIQERRRQAEERFLEAKAKHDEYERQHQDVDRALRGELPVNRRPRSMPRMETMESFDMRPVSEQSMKNPKLKSRDKLRMSLFGR